MRDEFSKPTKREALRRSGGFCEAVGKAYGLPSGVRCNAPLSHGVEFDHYPVPATERDSDGLDNCVACCKTCHAFKTRMLDIPVQAKTKRVSDKHLGISDRRSNWPTQRLGNGNNQHRATTPLSDKFALLRKEPTS